MDIIKVEKILRVLILIGLVVLLLFLLTKNTDSCQMCKYELDNESLGVDSLVKKYSDTCFKSANFRDVNLGLGNFTGN